MKSALMQGKEQVGWGVCVLEGGGKVLALERGEKAKSATVWRLREVECILTRRVVPVHKMKGAHPALHFEARLRREHVKEEEHVGALN